MATLKPRLAMLGPAAGARSGMAGVVDAYRSHRLFEHWPIEYLATHGQGGPRENAKLVLTALWRLVGLLATERQLLVHLHLSLIHI